MITVVMRPFTAGTEELKPGTIVDSSDWRMERQLLDQRRLRPATKAEQAEFAKTPKPPRSMPASRPATAHATT